MGEFESVAYESKPYSNSTLAIVLATNRPKLITGFLENLELTATNKQSFEVLIRADKFDDETINAIKDCFSKVSYRICLLVEPNVKGTYQLHKAYTRLLKDYSSPSVYFACNLTDEIRFESHGWDEEINSYAGFYKDNVFRLTFSRNKLRNYYHYEECIYFPDNYPIVTKKWLELCGGWGDFWGTDSWLQCITYWLGKYKTRSLPEGIFRSIPLYNIVVSGQENGVGLQGEKAAYHQHVVEAAICILSSVQAKAHFNKLAARLAAHISAAENNQSCYHLIEEPAKYQSIILSQDKSYRLFAISYLSFEERGLSFFYKWLAKFSVVSEYSVRRIIIIVFGLNALAQMKKVKNKIFKFAFDIIYNVLFLFIPRKFTIYNRGMQVRLFLNDKINFCREIINSLLGIFFVIFNFFYSIMLKKVFPVALWRRFGLNIIKIAKSIRIYSLFYKYIILYRKYSHIHTYYVTGEMQFLNPNNQELMKLIDSVL